MAITYRLTKGLPLTNAEIDDNFQFIEDELDTKLDSASYTASDVLTKLLTVDINGSGINATTLNGITFASANTVSTLVQRDSSGNFSAGTITAELTGNVGGNVTGNVTGDLTGDVKATNGTTVLDSGTTGSNATFTGLVNNITLTRLTTGFSAAGGTTSKTLTVSNTLTLTGTDSSSVAFGTGGTVAYTANKLSVFAATTSTELRGVISDETGSGALVFATSPSLTTPTLGVASATSINRVAITAPATSATLTIADGKTLTSSNTVTLSGTDGSTLTFGSGGTVAYTANKLSAFAATTSNELASIISDETGTGALVFGTNPTVMAPTYATASSAADTDTTINAATTDVATLIVSFTATRTINVSNLTAGRRVMLYIRNTNPTARTINIAAGVGATFTAVALSRSGAASVTSYAAAANTGTAMVTLFNVGGTIVGSLA
jgi:hypothetical protein